MQSALYYMKKYGTSYYYATLFFPNRIKRDVMQLYKFVRIPDLVVDDKMKPVAQAREELIQMRKTWEAVYNVYDKSDLIWGNSVELFHRCEIPFSLSKDFREAMLMDTEKFTYATYEELKKYMYGSAMVVGEMMCYVIGAENMEHALPYARKLGEAMQFTNFLRDVKEDFCDFGRIYMPLEDLEKFGITEKHIHYYVTTGEIDNNRKQFMKMAVKRADSLYEEAINGIQYLPKETRKAIYLSAKLYQGILRKIERRGYNVFRYSTRTGKRDKLFILLSNIR